MALITAVISGISIFLPWLESSAYASFGGYSSSISSGGISGSSLNIGILAIVASIAAVYLVYNNKANSHLVGAGMLLIGLGVFMGWFGALEDTSFSANYGGLRASASINHRFGLYLYIAASAAYLYYAFQLNKSNLVQTNVTANSETTSETNQ